MFLNPPHSPKISQPLPNIISTHPKKIATPLEKMSTPPEKNVNSASLIIPNLTQKISTRTHKNCQPLPTHPLPPENFAIPPPKILQSPPKKNFSTPPPKISQPPPKKFLNPPPKISQPPTKITSYGKITGNNKKVIKLRRRCEDKASTHYLI